MNDDLRTNQDDSSIKSSASNVWLMKVWAPLLWLIWGVALFKDDVFSWRIIAGVPFLLAFVFHMSLATVRIRNEQIQFRRLFRWNSMDANDIKSAGVVWRPFIGYVRLRQARTPWSRIFFVLDSESDRVSSRQRGEGIVNVFRQSSEIQRQPIRIDDGPCVPHGKLLLAFGFGVSASLARVYLSRAVLSAPVEEAHGPPLMELAAQVLAMIGNPQFAIPLLAFFVALTVVFRNRPSAWSFAFLTGVVVPFVLYPGIIN